MICLFNFSPFFEIKNCTRIQQIFLCLYFAIWFYNINLRKIDPLWSIFMDRFLNIMKCIWVSDNDLSLSLSHVLFLSMNHKA